MHFKAKNGTIDLFEDKIIFDLNRKEEKKILFNEINTIYIKSITDTTNYLLLFFITPSIIIITSYIYIPQKKRIIISLLLILITVSLMIYMRYTKKYELIIVFKNCQLMKKEFDKKSKDNISDIVYIVRKNICKKHPKR